MKALIGMLLTVAMATDYGGTATAQECSSARRVTRHKSESGQVAVNGSHRKCVCKSTTKRKSNISEMRSRSYSGFRGSTDTLNNGGTLTAPTESGQMNNENLNNGTINSNNNFEDTAIHYPSNGYDNEGFHHSIGSPRQGR